jgi:hypothetical protein
MNRTHMKGLRSLVDQFTGRKGIAWGPSGKDRGTHIALHLGEGADGAWASATLSNAETISFANKFVRSLTNAEHLPAIRELIEDETRGLRAEVTRLRCELLEFKLLPVSPIAVPPYSATTALVVAPSRALVLVRKGGAA